MGASFTSALLLPLKGLRYNGGKENNMPVMKGNTLDFFSYSAPQTRRFGAHLGTLVQPGDAVLLYGEMGAGKTHFAQGIAQGLGITGPVRSPTFTLINEYHDGRIPLYHVDLYRLSGDDDLATVGLEEYFDADGVVVVEWPERGVDWLPTDALHIRLTHIDQRRRTLRMEAGSPRAEELLRDYKLQTFAGTKKNNKSSVPPPPKKQPTSSSKK